MKKIITIAGVSLFAATMNSTAQTFNGRKVIVYTTADTGKLQAYPYRHPLRLRTRPAT